MKLDTIARQHAQAAHDSVAAAERPALDRITRPSRTRWVTAVAVGAAAAAAIAVTAVVVSSARTPERLAPAATSPPVSAPEAAPQDQIVILPASEDDLAFDTAALGTEQPLLPAERISAFAVEVLTSERYLEANARYLEPLSRVAVGYLPGTERVIALADGIIGDPVQAGYGGPGRCVWVASNETDGVGECHPVRPDQAIRPVGTGIDGADWVAWGFLPDDAAVAVLTVDGVDTLWQRPAGGIAAFNFAAPDGAEVGLRVLDADGVEIATGDRTRPVDPSEPTVEPTLGYGDYSGVAYEDVDWVEVTTLLASCLGDHGYPVEVIPPGDGLDMIGTAHGDAVAARFAYASCRAGLRLPEATR